MRCNGRFGRVEWRAGCVTLLLGLGGCASPPSVGPLIRSAGAVLEQEQKLLEGDAVRVAEAARLQRAGLDAGFESDLRTRPQLDADWVLEGAKTYVAAREVLLEHELAGRESIQVRQENLRLAGAAMRRASEVIERQDELFAGVPDVRRWLTNPTKETGR